MYSNIKSVQLLIALLKKYEIRDIILSPGGSDIPLIHSIEGDDFFTCHSVVDERSAAYYAMGVAQAKNRPAACICTSGSAVCNYVPGITEAYYQNVPVVAITADKNPYFQDQLETQKIEQRNMFNGVVKKAVDLPLIQVDDDVWLCERLINEALLELNHHGRGPVHINIPIVERTDVYDCAILPEVRRIRRITSVDEKSIWKKYAQLLKGRKIMVVVGQNINFTEEDVAELNDFFAKTDSIYAVEHLSNLECRGTVYTYPLTEMCNLAAIEGLKPDIVISVGNNLSAYNLKQYLRVNSKSMQNWLVTESGQVRDAYKCLTDIFECSVSDFLGHLLPELAEETENEHNYFHAWENALSKLELPQFEFSNFYVGMKLADSIPEGSLLHLAILNSTRIMQFFKLAPGVKTFSNVGTLGIDGCFSTFAGQAAVTEGLAYLVIGDLSFFYDMNAAGLRSIGSNVRVIMLNNGGGSEFHFFMGKKKIPTIDSYICAEHKKSAEGWIRSLGYDYYSASSKEEFDSVVGVLARESDKPVFLEVFTDMEEDAIKTQEFYSANGAKYCVKQTMVKSIARAVLSEKQINKVKKAWHAIKDN